MAYKNLLNSYAAYDDASFTGTLDFSGAVLSGFPVDNTTIRVNDSGVIEVMDGAITNAKIDGTDLEVRLVEDELNIETALDRTGNQSRSGSVTTFTGSLAVPAITLNGTDLNTRLTSDESAITTLQNKTQFQTQSTGPPPGGGPNIPQEILAAYMFPSITDTYDLGNDTRRWGNVTSTNLNAATQVFTPSISHPTPTSTITFVSPISTGDVLPTTSLASSLGSSSKVWNSLYAKDPVFSGTMSAGAITVASLLSSGTVSCGANSMTCGPLSSTSITASGTVSCGANAMTCGALSSTSITASGTVSCGANAMTCGALACTSMTSSGTLSCGTQSATVGALSCRAIGAGTFGITCGAITASGTVSCGANALTCGAMTSTSVTNSGTLSSGASTVSSLLSNGTLSCGVNAATVGALNSASVNNSGTLSSGASTVSSLLSNGTISCGVNAATVGALSSASVNNSGTLSSGATTVSSLLSNGTFSCGANAATCGALTSTSITASGTVSCGANAMTCGALASTSITASGTVSCGANAMTCGALSTTTITASGAIETPRLNRASNYDLQWNGTAEATVRTGALYIPNKLCIGTSSATTAGIYCTSYVANVASEATCIRASSATNSTKIELENTDTGGKLIELRSDNGTGGSAFLVYNRTNTLTYSFFNGTTAAGAAISRANNVSTWTVTSDGDLKESIEDNDTGLREIVALRPRRFHYRENTDIPTLPSKRRRKYCGLVAQEVQEVFPDAVFRTEGGYLALNLDEIHYTSINAIKELADEVEQLKNRVKILEG